MRRVARRLHERDLSLLSAALPPYISRFRSGNGSPDGKTISDIQFVNIAYYTRPPTAMGGPNGVLRALEEEIGAVYRGMTVSFVYEPKKWVLPDAWSTWIRVNEVGAMGKKLLSAHHFLMNDLGALEPRGAAITRKMIVAICHDLGTAAAAALNAIPFVLVYHHQGAFEFERSSFGETPNDAELYLYRYFEHLAFTNALEVHFPSAGARQLFFATTVSVKEHECAVWSGEPMYSAVCIDPAEIDVPDEFFRGVGRPDLSSREARSRFALVVSTGDYSINKGLDRCPPFLSELATRSSKPILWLALGYRHRTGLFARLISEQKSWPFDAVLTAARIPHSELLGILAEADLFLMQHRSSVFDFGILEAIALGVPTVLSPEGGNLELAELAGAVLVDSGRHTSEDVVRVGTLMGSRDKQGARKKREADSPISREAFCGRYLRIYDRLIDRFVGKMGSDPTSCKYWSANSDPSELLMDVFDGQDVLIVGAGSSALELSEDDTAGKALVALNTAVRLPLPFDVYFRQDEPPDLDEANFVPREALRVLGVVNRAATNHLSISEEFIEALGGKAVRYALASTAFDSRYFGDDLWLANTVPDLYGVLFSAILIAVDSGAKTISLAGVDFSKTNFDGVNPNKYNKFVLQNLAFLSRELGQRQIPFGVVVSYSADVVHAVSRGALIPRIDAVPDDELEDSAPAAAAEVFPIADHRSRIDSVAIGAAQLNASRDRINFQGTVVSSAEGKSALLLNFVFLGANVPPLAITDITAPLEVVPGLEQGQATYGFAFSLPLKDAESARRGEALKMYWSVLCEVQTGESSYSALMRVGYGIDGFDDTWSTGSTGVSVMTAPHAGGTQLRLRW